MVTAEQNQLPTPDTAHDAPAADPTAEDGGLSVSDGENAAAQQPAQPDGDGEASLPKPTFHVDDKRNAIYAKADKTRQEAMRTEFSGHHSDPLAVYGNHAEEADDLPEADQAVEQQIRPQLPQQQGQQAKPLSGNDPAILQQRVKHIVNGREQEFTVEELLRNSQINTAADQKLALAGEILRRAQEAAGQAQSQRPAAQQQFGTEEQAQERGNTSRQLPPNARELAEKIQLGDPEEAVNAITTLVETLTKANQQPAIDHATAVLSVLEDRNSEEALEKFAKRYPDIVQDQDFQEIVAKRARQEMLNDLQRAGYTPEQIEGWNTAGRLHELHKFARVNRVRNVRSVPELMEQAYTDAYTWRHGRPPQAQAQQQQHTSMQAREQRKEQLQNQPAARRMSPGLQPQKQQSTVTQDRKSAFQQMRESRGFGRG